MLRSKEPQELKFYAASTSASAVAEGINLQDFQPGVDAGKFVAPYKCRVHMAGLTITEGWAGTSAFGEIRFDKRPTAGSDTGRGNGDVGIIFFGNVTGASAQGDFVYDRAGTSVTLQPGQEVVVEVRSGTINYASGGRGAVIPHLLVEYLPETRSNLGLKETA